jgi:hypothetical protein
MIQSDFDYTLPLNQAILLLLGLLLLLQCGLLFRKHRHSRRFAVRIGLNVLLWAAIMTFVFKPYFLTDRQSATGLIISKNVPSDFSRQVKDSLVSAEVMQPDKLEDISSDTLILIGQDFPKDFFARIKKLKKAPVVRWIPYFALGQLQALHWKGIVRKGEMQVISGTIKSAEKQVLKVRFGAQTLDSALLVKGLNDFSLMFPVFGFGRTATELVLGDQTLDTLRFFARPDEKLTIRFLLNSPDFESRNLANWLGKNGHSVLYEATLSRDIKSTLNLNKAKDPDLIVTVPASATSPVIKKAVSAGKSVLFTGLTDVVRDLSTINAAFGTGFRAKRISNDDQIALSPELNALPYAFVPSALQDKSQHYPVLAEKANGRIVVSLLNETFPLQLAGDSVGYQRIWNEILALARPVPDSNASWTAPLVKGIQHELRWNNFPKLPASVRIGNDTVFSTPSALNSASVTASFRPFESGWVKVSEPEEAEMYVQETSGFVNALRMEELVKSAKPLNARVADVAKLPAKTPIRLPDWAWYAILMVVFAAVWIEQKL